MAMADDDGTMLITKQKQESKRVFLNQTAHWSIRFKIWSSFQLQRRLIEHLQQ